MPYLGLILLKGLIKRGRRRGGWREGGREMDGTRNKRNICIHVTL
jgi:hypothetical protein